MRMLHQFSSRADAELLRDALFAEQVEASVRDASAEGATLWVHDDEDLELSKEILAIFLAQPNDPRFDEARKIASSRRKDIRVAEKRSRHTEMRARDMVARGQNHRPATQLFVGAAALLFLLDFAGKIAPIEHYFFLVDPGEFITRVYGMGESRWTLLADTMMRGEIWRLFASTFLHANFFHILFNVMWLWQLGRVIEGAVGHLRFALMFFFFAIAGELLEYAMTSPFSVGLSGAVYGLFGYIWIRGRYDPTFPAAMPKNTVVWMIGWYILCFTGILGPIANWAHTGGLVSGMLLGIVDSKFLIRKLRRPS